MLGATIIKVENKELLSGLGLVDITDGRFPMLDLNALLTIDFEVMLNESENKWTAAGPPAILDESSGLVVFGISEDGLNEILAMSIPDDSVKQDDLSALRNFVEQNGADQLFELETF